MKINVLPPAVYNKIAAGEVVDRPYSVVKELVENAIDAGATEIRVEIEGGGKRLIRVTDNGSGMGKDDLPLAYSSHATSKLYSADDLFSIRTLGFRGEAIASVAAVSRMEIVSRTQEGDAYSLACEGGALGEVRPAAGAKGTVVTVEDLFYNVPARLKFLKSDAQEEADIGGVMARFLLSRPQISFEYIAGGKVKYRSFGDGLQAALAAVYGAETIGNCIEIDAEKHGIRLRGFLGSRNFYKANRTYQSLFVNGRYVVNQTVGAAVTNAYASYLMKRQYPFYVLFLDIPPEAVDVNVHPNKADVRFADNQVVYGCVYSVVSAVLDGNSRALEYLVNAPAASAGSASPVDPAASAAPAMPAQKSVQDSFFAPSVPKSVGGGMSYAEAKKELAFDVSIPKEDVRFLEDAPVRMEVRQPAAAPAAERQAPAAFSAPAEDVFAENKRLLSEQSAKLRQERVDPAALEYKGELFRTYLIYEAGDTAYFVDQHAAHERILFNRLQAAMDARAVRSQPMLVPFVLSLNGQEFAFLEKNFGVLHELGFEVEEFGDASVRVTAVPADLKDVDLAAFFSEVLSSMENLRAIRLADILKDKLATAACKAAVKGGETLTLDEVRALLKEMDGDTGMKCPHGRPAVVRMKKSEFEKLFKRIV